MFDINYQPKRSNLAPYIICTVLIWTIMVGILFIMDVGQLRQAYYDMALMEARAVYNKDMAFRMWGASHGGVYVPVKNDVQPNPLMAHLEERDVVTPSGQKLTLLNPANMVQATMSRHEKVYGIKGHITSLNHLAPENAPDEWEKEALLLLNSGTREVTEIISTEKGPRLRLMKPIHFQESCLNCHRNHNKEIGSISGGISVSMPLDHFFSKRDGIIIRHAFSHIIIFLFGLSVILLSFHSIRKNIRDRDATAEELGKAHKELEQRVAQRTADLRRINIRLEKEIAERQQAEKAMKETEANYHSLFSNMINGVAYHKIVLDENDEPVDYIFLEVNDKFEEMTGFKRENVIGKKVSEVMPDMSASPGNWIETYGRVAIHGEPLCFEEYSEDLDSWYSQTIYSPAKGYFVAIFENITERKKAEQSHILLFTAVEHAAESICITDKNGVIQYVNPGFEKISGFGRDEIIGCTSSMLKSGKHGPSFYNAMWSAIKSGKGWHGIITNKNKNGFDYDVEMTISPIMDDKGAITNYVAVKRDVTREKSLEKQLRQSQKMEAIGTLAGGIAHDFNNILGAIIGYTQLALQDAEKDSEINYYLEQVLNAGDRAAELVSHILTFSRQTEQELKPVLMTAIVKEALKMLRASLPSTIEIITDLKAESDTTMGDPTQIHQLLLNLCTNAAHAMKDNGGQMTIELDRVEISKNHPLVGTELNSGQYLMLKVSDTGHGIKNEIQHRIFDPYFTTKPLDEGTGMGLAIVHGIVKSHNGEIILESKHGRGASFTVYLPICAERESVHSQTVAPLEKGSGRILLVDDEEALVDMWRRILKRLGYEVVSRTSSVEALEAFRAQPERFDLVITDQTMPNMTGNELSRAILEIAPETPIILCTGFSQTISMEKAKEIGIRDYIMKPILMSDIARTIKKVMNKNGGPPMIN